MLRQLSMLAALLMSSGLISVAHGALGALMVQQGANLYGFSDTFVGLLVTITYIGFIAGNYLFRWMLPRISYIRTFAVCAGLLTTTTLLMPLLPVEIAWASFRFAHGLFFSTTVVICESWLNSSVDNKMRGKVHATMMTVNYVAYGASQYILLLGDGQAFIIAALFMVLSLVPICLTRFAEPQSAVSDDSGHMTIRDAYRIAPIAYLAQLGNGLFTGATWLFVRYAEAVADNAALVSTLAVMFFGSGFLLQIPIGWVSDRVRDRRTVINAVYLISSGLAVLLFFGDRLSSGILMFIVLLFGMVSATAFSLAIAYGQDFAGAARAGQYASRLFQPFAFGAIIGPFVAGSLMEEFSPAWLFLFIAVVCGGTSLMTMTGRIMPRYIPINQSTYQVASGYTATATEDLPQYNEHDIGPELPEEHDMPAADAPYSEDVVGPHLPEDEADTIADDDAYFVGPMIQNEGDGGDDDSDFNWKKGDRHGN